MRRCRLICLLTVLVLSVLVCIPAFALDSATLHNGSRGEAVRKLQQALIDLGFLKGKADGIFGNKTEDAVRRFQRANKLKADGLAGKQTQAVLFADLSVVPASDPPAESSDPTPSEPVKAITVTSADGLFSGNYETMRMGSSGSRVRILQQALIDLKYLSGRADGKFGSQTQAAVLAFQKQQRLSQDGAAGKKTLTALEKAVKSGAVYSPVPEEAPVPSDPTESGDSPDATSKVVVAKVSGPDTGSVRLLHWFNDIKPSLKNGDHLLIYEPGTGLSWTLKVISRGRHCDAEPLTREDTDTMVRAFGNKNTWNQKGVYVRLPGGVWTVGSTHDMPHMTGTISDNGFDGHLCVHFLRNMDETKANDPNYGVSNQETIRALWKKISGADVAN